MKTLLLLLALSASPSDASIGDRNYKSQLLHSGDAVGGGNYNRQLRSRRTDYRPFDPSTWTDADERLGESRTDVPENENPVVPRVDPSEEERVRNDEQKQLDALYEDRPPPEEYTYDENAEDAPHSDAREEVRPRDESPPPNAVGGEVDERQYEQVTDNEYPERNPSEEERLRNDEQEQLQVDERYEERDDVRGDGRDERPPPDAEEVSVYENTYEETPPERTYDEIDGGYAEASEEGRTYKEVDGGYAQGGDRDEERSYEDVEGGYAAPRDSIENSGYAAPSDEERTYEEIDGGYAQDGDRDEERTYEEIDGGYAAPSKEEPRVYDEYNSEAIANELASQSIVKQDMRLEEARTYEPAPKSSKRTVWIAHGLLAALTFGLLLPASISSALFRDYLPSYWIYIHVFLNILSFLVTLIAVILAFIAMSSLGERNEGHLKEMHHIVGLALLLLISFQTANGFLRPPREFVTDIIEDSTPGAVHFSRDPRFTPRNIWQFLHRVAGFVLFLGGTWQVRSGLAIYARRFSTADYGSLYLGYIVWLVFVLAAAKLYFQRPGGHDSSRRQGEFKGLDSMDPLGPTRLSDKNSDNASVGSHDLEERPDDATEDFMQSELSNISTGFANSFGDFNHDELQRELEDCLEKADNAAKDLAESERSGSGRGSGSTMEMVFGMTYLDKADVKKFEVGNFADNYYSSESDGGSDYVNLQENRRSSFKEELGMKLAESVSSNNGDPYAPPDHPLDDLDEKIAKKIAMTGGNGGENGGRRRSKSPKKLQKGMMPPTSQIVTDYLL